jgi:hypothetical protein
VRPATGRADARVLGGLPVTVAYSIYPGDPDVGTGSELDWEIVAVAGRQYRGTWVDRRLSEADLRLVDEACFDAADAAAGRAWADYAEEACDDDC